MEKYSMALIRAHNPLFFSKNTMRFFGKQKFKIENDKLKVTYLEKCPRVAWWWINPIDYRLTPIHGPGGN